MTDRKLMFDTLPTRDTWVRDIFLNRDTKEWKELYFQSWDLADPNGDIGVEHYNDGTAKITQDGESRMVYIGARQCGKTQRQRELADKIDKAIKNGLLYRY